MKHKQSMSVTPRANEINEPKKRPKKALSTAYPKLALSHTAYTECNFAALVAGVISLPRRLKLYKMTRDGDDIIFSE